MSTLYKRTPEVAVLDNRGLTVRTMAYHRHPETPDATDERIIRHQYDARGTRTSSADPRLHAAGLVNFRYISDLNGEALLSHGVDNGTTAVLRDAAGRLLLTVTADGVMQCVQYESADLPGRALTMTEQVSGKTARITDRFVYAGNSETEKTRNLAGVCIKHYDTAGLMQTDSINLTGTPLSVTRRLLKDADNLDTVADWQGGDASAWNDLTEAEDLITLTTTDATGATLTSTDAKGNRQRIACDVAGQLKGSWLTLKGGTEQVIIKSLTYSAAGQKLREEHGNGVVTTYTYEAETQRLTGIKTERPAGHASGTKVLQDLRYEYDPVGNVLGIRNDAEETRFWRNQKVVPENRYTYDSLYQLVSATGREMANAGQQSHALPDASPFDSATYTNYIRIYSYDSGGNLTQMRHSPATGSGYTTRITISDGSNRGVLSSLTETPSDVDALFTAGGEQMKLLPGQVLSWTPRDELQKVTPVVREGDASDRESYRYDTGSQRILKVSIQKTGNSTQTQRALYLPGLERRSTTRGNTETESLQVVTMGEAGRAQVRVLHWESGRPDGIGNNQIRYSYDNLTDSSSLELDGDGNIISQEEYYPYGGTAIWTARSQMEANYKTVRFSGKERDTTGLYYHGYRYYQPWAGRWLSSDPAGTVDGLNLFRMVRNNPASLLDPDGMAPEPVGKSVRDRAKLFESKNNQAKEPATQSSVVRKPVLEKATHFEPKNNQAKEPATQSSVVRKPMLEKATHFEPKNNQAKEPATQSTVVRNAPVSNQKDVIQLKPTLPTASGSQQNSEVRKVTNTPEVDDNESSMTAGGFKLNDSTFNTALLRGNPIGKDIDLKYPLPAQAEAFKSVIEEKKSQIEAGGELKAIDVWRNPQTGNIHILDGQHRFLAAAEKGMHIKLNWKKLGFPAFNGTWKNTYYSNAIPAKEVLKKQKKLAQ